MKTTTTLRNLSELDVSFVSLVDRGANRLPFRIVKRTPQQENPMGIDLSRLAFRKSAAPVQKAAELLAIILAPEVAAATAEVQAVLKAEGVEFGLVEAYEDGTSAVTATKDFADGDHTVIRVSENMAVVVKGFEPWGAAMADMPFAKVAQSQGFYSGLEGAMSTLRDMVYTKMTKADSPSSASSDLKALASEFADYVTALASALPEAVFKIERPLQAATATAIEVAKSAKGKPKEGSKSEEAGETTDKESEEEKATRMAKEKAPAKKADDETPPATISPELLSTLSSITETLSSLKGSMEGLAGSVVKIEAAQTATEAKVASALQKSEDATRAVQGTVAAAAASSDPEPKAPVTKSDDDDGRSGIFDTAYLRKREPFRPARR